MKDAGDDGILIHIPLLQDFHDGERMDNVRLPSFAQLAFVRLSGDLDSLLNAWGIAHTFIISWGFVKVVFTKNGHFLPLLFLSAVF
jgi:hypothetical protein